MNTAKQIRPEVTKMKKSSMIIFAITVIGTIACVISFIIALTKSDNMISTIFFGVAAFTCFTYAVKTYRSIKK